ncbi:MAG: beta-galactosidase [bacterium]|nr:beta-galactosidase [bacterium]
MSYRLDLSNIGQKNIYDLDERFCGRGQNGEEISFTNYYMQRDREPFFGVGGEFHFSRTSAARWEQEILKMKACGINTISTYLFWIHHEEEEGVFDFTGCRDLRKFLTLCKKHSVNVILRIGPFSHGECRNGGFPDWLFAEPFEMRKLSEGYLYYVRRYFTEIGKQTKGLYFKDGGPVIAVQIDNEYMHSSSLWSFSWTVNHEFVFGGDEGDEYMIGIRDVALSCGIEPVFFTATGWGGAITPECMIPMWGGYCYRPWMPMPDGIHPPTDEFIYQDFHRNGVETAYDFHPAYEPETKPYGCCEIGAGIMVGYTYRAQYPYKSVDAIANVKIASGCNFLGYYMYHGGSHPLGKHGGYTNDGSLPKISYDYQAAIGEYGQVRESAKRSKNVHYFANTFRKELCPLQTVLPPGASQISPEDRNTLRFAVRTDGKRGFLFVNNFQDHAEMPDRAGEEILLRTEGGELSFSIDLAGDENAILPFHLDLDGIELIKATAQPVTVLEGEVKTYVFFVPTGLGGEFTLEEGAKAEETGSNRFSFTAGRKAQLFTAVKADSRVRILVISRKMADNMYLVKEGLVFTDAVALQDENGIRLETERHENFVYTYPETLRCTAENCREIREEKISEGGSPESGAPKEGTSKEGTSKEGAPKEGAPKEGTSKEGTSGERSLQKEIPAEGNFERGIPKEMRAWLVSCEKREITPVLREAVPHRYLLTVPKGCFEGLRDVMLRIDYVGDIGNAFLNHRLINDNYSNGKTWEVGLSDFREELAEKDILLYISPIKEGAKIVVNNQMAAVNETVEKVSEKIGSVRLDPVYDIRIC